MTQILMETHLLACGVLVCASFIPSYKLFVAIVPNALPGIANSVDWIRLTMIVQCVVWILVERMLQVILYSSRATSHRFAVFPISTSISRRNHSWNVLLVGICSPSSFVLLFFRFMGATAEGELWFFGSDVLDIARLTWSVNSTTLISCRLEQARGTVRYRQYTLGFIA